MTGFEPDVAAALELLERTGRPPVETLSVTQARALYRAGRDTVQLLSIPIESVANCELAGRPARRYRPTGGGVGAVLFCHGGGYVIGDLDTHDGICRHLAACGLEVVALEYRLAPEHRFPAAFEDCLAAYWALPGPIAIAGDSAGGALALAVALTARPRALALFYPVADVAAEAPSYARVRDVPSSAETMRWFWKHTFATEEDRRDVRASPLRSADLAQLPPVFLTTAGHDPLCDEGLALADALCRAGVRVEHRHLPGQVHGYLTLGRLIGEAERSIAAAGRFLADQLRDD